MQDSSLTEVKAEAFMNIFPLSKSIRNTELRFYKQSEDSFVFENLLIQGPFLINSTDPNPSAYLFANCTFDGPVTFENPGCEANFYFRQCTFSRISFNSGVYKNTITFDSCIADTVWIGDGAYQELTLSFNNCDLSIEKGNFDNLMIGDWRVWNSLFHHITLHSSTIKGNVTIQKLQANSLTLLGEIDVETNIKVEECQINHMIFSHLVCKGQCSLDLVMGHKGVFSISPVYPVLNDDLPVLIGTISEKEERKAKLHYLKSFFAIEYSDLTGVKFLNMDFSSYHELNVFKSRLTEIQFSNIIWPSQITTHYPHNSKFNSERFLKGFKLQKRDYLDKREVYRQLKFACSKQHDFIGEQHFHALEMNAYDHTLLWFKDFWTKLVLKLSMWTSNFGQSVIRPLIGIVIINGFLFYLLHLTGDGPFKSFDLTKGENYVNTVAEFIRFVNPLHKNDPELKGWAFIIDVLIRICSSYFIYNLIRATRRFVR